MATEFPSFTDIPEGSTPAPGTPDVDAAFLNSLTNAVNIVENQLPAKANADDLATVATTGAYTDLVGVPFIPDTPDDIGAQPVGDYATTAELAGKANTSHTHVVGDLSVTGTPDGTKFLRDDGTWAAPTQTGVSDHGALTGLADDDHTQYHTDARGDARYYTQGQVDTALGGKANTAHTHAASDIASGRLVAARMPVVPSTVRSQASSATPTISPTVDGNIVNFAPTVDVTALAVSTTGATDGQVLRIRVHAASARSVTFAAAIRTSTGVTRGPFAIPAGQVLFSAVEYSSAISAWTLTAATTSAT